MVMKNSAAAKVAFLLTVALAFAGIKPIIADKPAYATLTSAEAITVLDQVEKDIQENYYDPTMHGVDLHKRFDEARAKIKEAQTQDDALLAIAGAVAVLHDSHTKFIPPMRPYEVDYGFVMQAVGDTACYVEAVKPGSDAEAKGLKRGDRIVSINGVTLTRQDIETVRFGYRVYPQSGFHLDVKPPEGDQKSLVVMAKVTPGQAVITHSDLLEWLSSRPTLGQDNKSQLYAVEKKVLFWKMPTFNIDPQDVGGLARKARSFETVVLDLRGNGGGSEDVLLNLLGHFFDHDVRIGDLKERKGSKPLVAKGHGDGAIGGKLIVLIDSNSASASEIFSRTIQLEKRGIVLGDRSEGAVMRAEFFLHAVQLNQKYVTQYRNQNFVTQYRSMVTAADLVLANGERLEGLGVKPDEPLIPTPADMAAGRDPVLSRAASLAGIEMTPAKAGEIFPFKWPSKPIKIE